MPEHDVEPPFHVLWRRKHLENPEKRDRYKPGKDKQQVSQVSQRDYL